MKQTLLVNGMHCKSCSILIQEALEEAGAKNVSVQLDEKKKTGTLSLDTTLTKSKIAAIIKDQGDYEVRS